MTTKEAQQILLLYRPGTTDDEDPLIEEAIAVARGDPELARWFEEHCAFQQAIRAKVRQAEVPVHLQTTLRTKTKILLPRAWWRRPAVFAPAAAAAIVLGVAFVWVARSAAPNQLANFEARMVGTAQREYRMDIKTPDMEKVREYLARNGAAGDYDISPALSRLTLTGGGVLRWRNRPVSMICFDRGDNQMVFLFVLDRSALKDPPPGKPRVSKRADYITASWSRGAKTYVLAGPEEPDFLEKYF